jgi:phage terminase small subunit
VGLTVPDWMSERQAKIYRETAAQIAGGVEGRTAIVLETYAVAKARWQEALEYLEENGQTVISRTDKGEIKSVAEAPQVKIAERAGAEVAKLSHQLRPA